MSDKVARADVAQLRQTTQFTCCATSITSALHALGKKYTEDDVNKVLGASPMAGATWEAMLATVQYFGCRGTLVVPSTPRMLKEWTDQGIPVVIAWNPEGRPWSHASTVFDVTEGPDGKLMIHVMDSNIPNPDETTRVLDADTFCQKWGEKVSDTLIVRRPAMAVTLEVSPAGRQMVASSTQQAAHATRYHFSVLGEGKKNYREVERDLPTLLKREGWTRVEIHDEMRNEHDDPEPASNKWASAPEGVPMSKKSMIQRVADAHEAKDIIVKEKNPKGPGRSEYGPEFVTQIMRHPGNGAHQNRNQDVAKGVGKPKHKKPWGDD